MSDVSKIKIGDEYYDIKDATARAGGGGDAPIEHISVNGTEQEITDKTVNISVPTKVSELDNDVPYGTEADVEAAQSTANDALTKATETAESAITAITVNGEDVPVEDNTAGITVEPRYDADSETLVF